MNIAQPAIYILLLFLLGNISVSHARAPEPSFPKSITLENNETTLSKLGEYRYVYRMFFKLYDAALFTQPNSNASAVLEAKTSFKLQFRYLRSIDKPIIIKSADKMLERNLSPAEMRQIETRVAQINEAYRSVQKGDRSSLTYIPGAGTTLRINGTPITTIEGRDFAQLYFKIWLGENSLSESLTQSLLGRTQPN